MGKKLHASMKDAIAETIREHQPIRLGDLVMLVYGRDDYYTRSTARTIINKSLKGIVAPDPVKGKARKGYTYIGDPK